MTSLLTSVSRLVAAVGLALAPPAAAAEASAEGLRALQQLGQVLGDTGYRLATAGTAFCAPVPLPGIQVQDLSQYPWNDQSTARITFGFEAEPLVFVVPANSPAAQAGLMANDAILAIDGHTMPPSEAKPNSFTRVAQVLDLIEHAARNDGKVTLLVRRHGQPVELSFAPAMGCASRFELRIARAVDAEADGQYVVVNSGAFEVASEPDELAVIVAHELAHNILKHRQRLDRLGRRAAAVRATEEEADRLSIYLLDRAGYPLDAATRFWSKLATRDRLGLFGSATHMSDRARIELMQTEAKRVAEMKAAGLDARPPFMSQPAP